MELMEGLLDKRGRGVGHWGSVGVDKVSLLDANFSSPCLLQPRLDASARNRLNVITIQAKL